MGALPHGVHDLRYGLMEKRVEMRKLFTDPKA